jgi:hypothetical protein
MSRPQFGHVGTSVPFDQVVVSRIPLIVGSISGGPFRTLRTISANPSPSINSISTVRANRLASSV